MDFIKLFLISILLFSCSNAQESKDSEREKKSIDTTKQWLTWNGNGSMPHIVFVSGDEEYRSEEALPQLAKILSERHGFKCTVLFAQDPEEPGIVDPNFSNNIPGLHHLKSANLMVLFTRFRALPDEQMKYIDDYLLAGKPVFGIRTSTHAFKFKDINFKSNYLHYGNYYDGNDEWKDGFGRLVMGERWVAHHGKHGHQSTKGIMAKNAKNHPIWNGINEGEIWGPTDVYEVRLPLTDDAQPIVLGQVMDRKNDYDENDVRLGMRISDDKLPDLISKKVKGKKIAINQNDPMMPVAWTKNYSIPNGKSGKCFSTTLGASTDLLAEGTRRMMVNAVFWSLDLEVPIKANVDLVGVYNPTRFAFHNDEYWDNKKTIISTLY